MDYRIGTCSQCGAEYKVPASFAHAQARCKKCPGTVNLSEVQGSPAAASQPAAMPAKKVVPRPKPLEEVDTSDAEGKRKERGTLARLRAERAAAASQEQPASPKPEPAKEEPKAPAKAAPVSKAKPAVRGSKKSAGSAGARSRRSKSGEKSEESTGSSRRKRSKPEKKKAPVGMIAIIALVVGGGGFAAFSFLGGSDDAKAKEAEPATSAGEEQAADTGMDDAQSTEVAAGTSMENDAEDDTMEDGEGTQEPAQDAPEAESAPEEKPQKVDVLVDLAALERCNPARGTTDEEWEQMNGWITDFLDPDSGAAGPRAGKKLGNLGRKGMPVLINGLLTLDYSTEEGINTGDTVQRMLKTIANGQSFGWWYFDNPRAEYLCRKASESWQSTWKRVEGDIEVYIKLAKLEHEYDGDGEDPLGPLRAKRMAEAASLREMYGSTE